MRLTVSICVLLALVIMLTGPSQPIPSGSHMQSVSSTASISILPGSTDLIIEVAGPDVFDEVSDIVIGTGSTITFSSRDTGILSFTAATDAESIARSLSSIPGVVSVSSEMRASASFLPDDPGLEYQWGLDTIDAYAAWDITVGDEETIVAVLDTGIDWNHPDLVANIWTNAQGYHGYNFIDDNWFPMDDNINGYDDDGDFVSNIYTYHGTHVAGIMGATIDNAIGIAGIAQVKLMAVKVMNDSGEGTDSTVSSGVRWAVDNGAQVIVMSLGLDGLSAPLQNAVNYATSRGVVLVASAGNSGTSVLSYPAAFPNVIAVGASDNLDRRASFSNFGVNLDVMAPGVSIYSTQGGGSYQSLSGTSAAAPHVAAIAALMLTLNPALTTVEVGDIINSTATDISINGYDTQTGWGIVNAFRAVEFVADPTVTITEFPESVGLDATFSVSWMVSGGDPGDIESTYLTWGYSETELTYQSDIFSGTTWAEFVITSIPSLPTNGTVYLKAY
ncbi:MAG: S8 family serine peptidase, partial [Thermoplasmata archaeon]|nr:S8 family serine peptidase [Thermoplasmata archaeon]